MQSDSAGAHQLLRERAAAELLSVSHRTLQRWRVTGDGPPFRKIGRRIAYHVGDLEVWINQRKHTSTTEYLEE